MKIISSAKSAQQYLHPFKLKGKSVGFVPTMGVLHEGHLSLIRKSRKDNDITVVSIFVNPVQFGSQEDLSRYPREEKKDKYLLQKEEVDLLFYPSADEMYPKGYKTYVEVNGLDQGLCGRIRPGHFKGVTTIVAKLLHIVTPDRLYLGQKDAQQAVIIGKMIQDLNFPIKTIVRPTVREKDGLAMSSRNIYLNKQHRSEATILFKALTQAKYEIKSGIQNPSMIIKNIKSMIEQYSSGIINYIECVSAEDLTSLRKLRGKILIALSVSFGKTKLIDNMIVHT